MKKKTREEFIEEARKIHGDKYDYSKVEYINNATKVCVICKEHGEFFQLPTNYLKGCGCLRCGGSHKSNSIEFIEKSNEIHNNKYDYSKVDYKNAHSKVCIICKEHGEFWQKPNDHLHGVGCPLCGGTKKKTKYDFIEDARMVHGDKYDYSKVEYINNHTKVCIICPKHGEFCQTPNSHLNGAKCSKCYGNGKLTTSEFIERAKKIHGDKYDYSKVEYKNIFHKVCIVCSNHGKFWQMPYLHLKGFGCSKCNSSRLENEIRLFLESYNFEFEEQKSFEWLRYKNNLSLDFYLPQYNTAIECQGIQHFNNNNNWLPNKEFQDTLKRDKIKRELCEKHGVNLLYYSNLGIDYPYEVIEDKELLYEKIIK